MTPCRAAAFSFYVFLACTLMAALAASPARAGGPEWPASLGVSSIDATIGLRINGVAANEVTGSSVGFVDANGDGLDDLLIGAPGIQGGAANAGGAYVVFGQAGGFGASPFSLLGLTGTNGGRYVGDQANSTDDGSHQVSAAGDVNGDGIGDFIVSSPDADPPDHSYLGSVYVVFGKPDGQWSVTQGLGTLNGTTGFRFDGSGICGFAVSSAGDFNGDGFADVLVGCPEASNGGQVYLIYGRAKYPAVLKAQDLTGAKGFAIRKVGASGEERGHAVRGLGDINGDGLADIIIGAYATGPTLSGEAHVVFGTKSKPASLNLATLGVAKGFRISTAGVNSATGVEVSGAGDVNGDGYRDLMVTTQASDPGLVFILFGSQAGFPAVVDLSNTGALNALQVSGKAGDYVGYVADRAGDINGDGFDDIVLSSPAANPGPGSYTGVSYVIFGSPSLAAGTLNVSSLIGTNGFAITGTSGNDSAGVAAGGGDVNGDGLSDLLIGGQGVDVGMNADAGSSYLLFGRLPLGPVSRSGSNIDQYITGGADADSVSGAGGNDVLEGRGDADALDGGPGGDTASYAHAPAPVIASLASPAVNTGDAAGDSYVSIENLEGSGFNDTLTGNGSANRITGGKGLDIMNGGGGPDTFIFKSIADSVKGALRDQIAGFNAGSATTFVDRLDLRAIDAKPGIAGNQAFKFIGSTKFGKKKGELRAVKTSGGIVVSGDVTGDGKADFEILLKNFTKISNLTAKDFLL